jgi:hypothetical protein
MKTIVVTGGAGFSGSHLAAESIQPTIKDGPGNIKHLPTFHEANATPPLSSYTVNKLQGDTSIISKYLGRLEITGRESNL